jgi:hypothetical protein
MTTFLLNSALPTHPFLTFGNFADKKSRMQDHRLEEDTKIRLRMLHMNRGRIM